MLGASVNEIHRRGIDNQENAGSEGRKMIAIHSRHTIHELKACRGCGFETWYASTWTTASHQACQDDEMHLQMNTRIHGYMSMYHDAIEQFTSHAQQNYICLLRLVRLYIMRLHARLSFVKAWSRRWDIIILFFPDGSVGAVSRWLPRRSWLVFGVRFSDMCGCGLTLGSGRLHLV